MTNPWRGEVRLTVDGRDYDLRLTLGALAELEEALGAGSLLDLVKRFDAGGYSSRDVLAILTAGLKGGRADPMPDVAQGEIAGGPVAAGQAAAQLLERAFAVPET